MGKKGNKNNSEDNPEPPDPPDHDYKAVIRTLLEEERKNIEDAINDRIKEEILKIASTHDAKIEELKVMMAQRDKKIENLEETVTELVKARPSFSRVTELSQDLDRLNRQHKADTPPPHLASALFTPLPGVSTTHSLPKTAPQTTLRAIGTTTKPRASVSERQPEQQEKNHIVMKMFAISRRKIGIKPITLQHISTQYQVLTSDTTVHSSYEIANGITHKLARV